MSGQKLIAIISDAASTGQLLEFIFSDIHILWYLFVKEMFCLKLDTRDIVL